ncbi:MAG: hypothetical protein WBD45_22105, partial [Terriglobales bacterium]
AERAPADFSTQFFHDAARLWKPEPTSPPTYTWRRNKHVSHPGLKFSMACADGECAPRFSSTPIMDRGILLGATWQSGTTCSTWTCRMDLEKELLDAFDRVVHEDFPNPQHIECPGRQILLKLAQQPADAQLSHLLDHVRRCAPCFDELKDLRREAKKR